MHLFIGRKEELTNDFLNSFQALIINFGSQKQEIDEFLFRFCQSCDDVLGTVFISDGRGLSLYLHSFDAHGRYKPVLA